MFKHVNKSARKKDGLSLATGASLFTDDFSRPDMLHISVLRSPHAYAKIKSIDESEALKMEGVVDVYSYKNVDRVMHTTGGQGFPEPSAYDCVLFDHTVRFVGDKVAAVVAETEEIAEEALKKIKVKYDVLKPIFDYTKSMDKGAPQVHTEDDAAMIIPVPYRPEENVAAEVIAEIGSFEEGYKKSKKQFEITTSTPIASHCAIEPHVAIAEIDQNGRLVITSSVQVPFHARRITAKLLKIPVQMIRVIKPRIGGGFGGKQEILLEPMVGLATWRTKRPTRMIYTRKDVFVSGRTRHAQRNTVKVGYNPEDGSIDAIEMYALENAGAYGSHALTVLTNTCSKVLPLLNQVENVKFIGRGVYTNLPVGGAYRGYGASQGYFSFAQMVDIIAEDAGMDPVDFYHKYSIKTGGTSEIFAKVGEGTEGSPMSLDSCGLDEALDKGSEAFDWKTRRAKYALSGDYNKDKRRKRGVGMACFMQGSAVPKIDMASAYMKINDDGSFTVLMGATDIGTGSDTILCQIAAEVLDCPIEKMNVTSSDTDFTPFDVGAYASSTTYLSGEAMRKCAVKIKDQILDVAAEMLSSSKDDLEVRDCTVYSKSDEKKSVTYGDVAVHSLYLENQFQIQASASHVVEKSPPPFCAHFAEIEVDTETGIIKVLDYVTATDCGTPINPQLCEGQIEGALANGLSYALTEEYKFNDKGVMLNSNFGRYKIYTAKDMPKTTTILLNSEYEDSGPYGAKSVSEVAINGPIPVIANAFYQATGKRLHRAPFTPEYVLSVLEDREEITY